MDAQTFVDVLKNRDRLFEIPWEQLKALSQEHPYSAHVWLLMLEKARLEQRPDFEELLEHVASRTFDRAFLYRYLRHLQTHATTEEHFQLAEDYLELKDLSELEQLEAAPQPPEAEREMAVGPQADSAPLPPTDENDEAALDDGERFASLEEVFQFPADLPPPGDPETEARAADEREEHEASEQEAAPAPSDAPQGLRGKVLSLDDLLAELPEEMRAELENDEEADEPASEALPPEEAAATAPPTATDEGPAVGASPLPGDEPQQGVPPTDFAGHGELAAAGVITARHLIKWLQGKTTQPSHHDVPFEVRVAEDEPRPAPLKRQQLESWQKLLHDAPRRHLFIAPDSEVEKPLLRRHDRPEEDEEGKKKKKKKSLPEPERIARQSLQTPPDLVSEPLARVLEQQGHYERAIIMYERLRLKYPEKSDFFAAKIEALKKKL